MIPDRGDGPHVAPGRARHDWVPSAVVEWLPVKLDDLSGRGRTVLQHSVHPLDGAAHRVNALAQMVSDLLDQCVVEDSAFLGAQHLLVRWSISTLRLSRRAGRDWSTPALRDANHEQVVFAAHGVGPHVRLGEFTVKQLHLPLDLKACARRGSFVCAARMSAGRARATSRARVTVQRPAAWSASTGACPRRGQVEESRSARAGRTPALTESSRRVRAAS